MKQITLSLLCVSAFSLAAIAEDTPAADNTKKNQRDRSGETKTSGDQSNSSQDVKITAAIRRAVVRDHSLSMTAKNVKIITSNGMVTLRGPVKSDTFADFLKRSYIRFGCSHMAPNLQWI